jgi:hypothetical protein
VSKCDRYGYEFGDTGDQWTIHAHSAECIAHLKSKIERLRAALAVYADHSNWLCDTEYGHTANELWPYLGNAWETAEQALKGGEA